MSSPLTGNGFLVNKRILSQADLFADCNVQSTPDPHCMTHGVTHEFQCAQIVQDSKSFLSGHAAGVAEGISKYAWWKEGVQYVGSGVWTLEQALANLDQEVPSA